MAWEAQVLVLNATELAHWIAEAERLGAHVGDAMALLGLWRGVTGT